MTPKKLVISSDFGPFEVPGYRLKDGKLVRTHKARSASDAIRQKKSKRVRVVRKRKP